MDPKALGYEGFWAGGCAGYSNFLASTVRPPGARFAGLHGHSLRGSGHRPGTGGAVLSGGSSLYGTLV